MLTGLTLPYADPHPENANSLGSCQQSCSPYPHAVDHSSYILSKRTIVKDMPAQEMSTNSAGASYYGGLGPAIVGVCWSLFAVATVLLGLRIVTYAAIVKTRGGWALVWACVAWV